MFGWNIFIMIKCKYYTIMWWNISWKEIFFFFLYLFSFLLSSIDHFSVSSLPFLLELNYTVHVGHQGLLTLQTKLWDFVSTCMEFYAYYLGLEPFDYIICCERLVRMLKGSGSITRKLAAPSRREFGLRSNLGKSVNFLPIQVSTTLLRHWLYR
jgi:hypothetical protein